MPLKHIIVCSTEKDVAPAKAFAQKQGGKITYTYDHFPGFDVMMPKDSVATFQSSPHVESAEVSGLVSTQ